MVRKFFFQNEKNIRKALPKIKEKIKAKLFLKGKIVFIEGNQYEEFIIEKILSAVDFGFCVDDCLSILDESDFAVINIKEFTNRKNLNEIRGRIIGKKGKSLEVIEELSGAKILLKKNKVGVIADSEHINETKEAIKSLIRGSKHGSVFSYLEKRNSDLKKFDGDLGLRELKKK